MAAVTGATFNLRAQGCAPDSKPGDNDQSRTEFVRTVIVKSCGNAAENGACKRSDHALGRGTQRSTDRTLHHDQDGEDRPVALLQIEKLVGDERRAGGHGHPQRLTQLRSPARPECIRLLGHQSQGVYCKYAPDAGGTSRQIRRAAAGGQRSLLNARSRSRGCRVTRLCRFSGMGPHRSALRPLPAHRRVLV